MRISRDDRDVLVDIILDELKESNCKKRDPELIKKDAKDKIQVLLKKELQACVKLNKESQKLEDAITNAKDKLYIKIRSTMGYTGYGGCASDLTKVQDYRNGDLEQYYENIYKKKHKYVDIPNHYDIEKRVLKSSDGSFDDIIKAIVSSLTK